MKQLRPNAWYTEGFTGYGSTVWNTYPEAVARAKIIVALKSQYGCEPVTTIIGCKVKGLDILINNITRNIVRL